MSVVPLPTPQSSLYRGLSDFVHLECQVIHLHRKTPTVLNQLHFSTFRLLSFVLRGCSDCRHLKEVLKTQTVCRFDDSLGFYEISFQPTFTYDGLTC